MCGNGLRCLAALAREHGHVGDEFVVETAAGLRAVRLCRDASRLGDVEVEVGTLEVDVAPIAVAVDGHDLLVRRAWLGNPHVVVFLDSDPEEFPVARVGLALQQHAAFEGGVNVEFVQLAGPATLRQRTFERGSGETLACGTGAAAAAGVAIHEGRLVGQEVTVLLRGGPLRVYQRGLGLVISGPAHTVYRGDVELPPP
jgi:diaminopimelate epimerase